MRGLGAGAGRRLGRRAGLCACLALSSAAVPALPTQAALLGVEPVPGVALVSEQGDALCRWHRAGARGMALVHLSARLNIASPQLDDPADVAAVREPLVREPCEAIAARTGSPPRRNALYDSDNYLAVAHRLGVVREVWWVVPSRQTLPGTEFEKFRAWLRETSGLPGEFLDGLRHEGAAITGAYQGMPIRIVTLADLPLREEPVLVDIDAEYLVRLYENPVKEKMLDLLGGFFATLRDRRVRAEQVVVSSSYRDGRVPLIYGYLGGWVRDFLARPALLAEGPPESWKLQGRIDYLGFMLAPDDARAALERLAALAPDAPAPRFELAWSAVRRGEIDAALGYLGEAVARAPDYRAGYLTLSQLLFEKGEEQAATEMLEQGWRGFPDDVAIGLAALDLLKKRELAADFETLARDLAGRHPESPAVQGAAAFALRDAGKMAEAQAAMDRFRLVAPGGGMRRSVLAAWER